MAFLLLIAGIACIIFAAKGLRIDSTPVGKVEVKHEYENSGGDFSDYLTDSMVMQKLDSMEEKLDTLYGILEKYKHDVADHNDDDWQSDIPDIDVNSIDEAILNMKSKGVSVEEMAAKLGVTKGEVLLRLGIKK